MKTLIAAGVCLFYLGNLWPLFHIDIYPFYVLWSLAFEEQYYLLWPVLLLAVRRIKTFWVLGGVLAMTLTSLVLRFTGEVTTPPATTVLTTFPNQARGRSLPAPPQRCISAIDMPSNHR